MAGILSCFSGTHRRKTRPGLIRNGNQANGSSSRSSGLTSSESQQGMKYSVFLSFRGTDTRNSFTSFLYKGLRDAGVDVYIDSKEIRASAEILPSLMEAIEHSTIAVPIFSRDYASSKSCLREIEKIYECRDRFGQTILPVFYYIEPTDVRNQTGPFEKSFRKHQKRGVDSQDLKNWKKALKEIGDLKGYPICKDLNQAEVVKDIVLVIIDLLRLGEIPVPRYLVGMDPCVQTVVEKLQVSSRDVRILGVCGMSGIGKTTIAQVVYNKLRPLYQCYAFISNIEERSQVEGIYTLQTQLISQLLKREYVARSLEDNKVFIRHKFSSIRVLIVLDDVECSNHVKAFADDFCCFGPGSRVLITTKSPTVIDEIRGAAPNLISALKHEMQPLNDSDSLKLFCWHAFGRDSSMGGYDDLSNKIAFYTGGIPQVIEVVGCYLNKKRDKETWEETSQELENTDHEKLQSLLSKCYEENLEKSQQQIFLDIACFLVGKSKTIAHHMWRACGFYPHKGVNKLLQLSLLKIGENGELLMTYPVTNFGQKLVIKENAEEPALRSRLWSHAEALEILREKKGTDKIEALCLKFDGSLTEFLTNEAFNGLSKLRFLRLDKAKLKGDFKDLLQNLRWLDLEDCSDIWEELENLSLKNLVILGISHSNIEQDWQGWKLIMENAEDLKVLVLTSCHGLQGSPTFTDRTTLERLSFENCSKLRRINMVSDALESLVYLNLKCCRDFNLLPHGSLKALEELIIDGTDITEINAWTLGMKNLKTLSASRCKNLTTIDESIGNLKSLLCLMLDDTAIEKLPSSIGSLTNLQNLSLRNCRKLDALPESVGKLSALTRMDLSDTAIKELPPTFERLRLLKVLLMRKTHIVEFPKSITKLERLEEIDFSFCQRMKGTIPDGITDLSSLKTLVLSTTAIFSLPDDISGLSHLQVLNLGECQKLEDLPHLPPSLTALHVGSTVLKKIPELSNMTELVELHLADNTGPHLDLPNDRISVLWPADSFQWIPKLLKLETLELHISKITELPVNFSVLARLRKLVLSFPQLQTLPELPPSLTILHLLFCESLTEYENLSVLTLLSELEVVQCGGVSISVENLRELRLLTISDCGLRELWGIEELHYLRTLTVSNCSIQSDLSLLEERGTEIVVYSRSD